MRMQNMKIVWIVTEEYGFDGYYGSLTSPRKAFLSEEKAREYIDQNDGKYEVVPIELVD